MPPNRIILLVLLSLSVIVVLVLPVSLPARVGAIDFRPYWSSSFLLVRGQDFSDEKNMDDVERTLTGWTEPYTMYAWFAPTGNLVLLPYTFFKFARATYYWLITNIAIVFFSVILLWREVKNNIWIPLVATFSFSMTFQSIYYGQVNTLVLLGFALFLSFSATKRNYMAGASLVLTTIKPHIAILALPLLFLNLIWQKQWRVLVGFFSTLIGCMCILYFLYPQWPLGFWHLVSSGMEGFRDAPTIAGLLIYTKAYLYGKWLWIAGLLLSVLIWWNQKKNLDQRILIEVTILAGMLISPIGWSYDQIILLIPLLHIFEWITSEALPQKEKIIIVLTLVIANLASFYQQTFLLNDVWFFWIPILVMVVYIFAWKQKQRMPLNALVQLGK